MGFKKDKEKSLCDSPEEKSLKNLKGNLKLKKYIKSPSFSQQIHHIVSNGLCIPLPP